MSQSPMKLKAKPVTRGERREYFAEKNRRRRDVRRQGREAVLRNRYMGRLLSVRAWKPKKESA